MKTNSTGLRESTLSQFYNVILEIPAIQISEAKAHFGLRSVSLQKCSVRFSKVNTNFQNKILMICRYLMM